MEETCTFEEELCFYFTGDCVDTDGTIGVFDFCFDLRVIVLEAFVNETMVSFKKSLIVLSTGSEVGCSVCNIALIVWICDSLAYLYLRFHIKLSLPQKVSQFYYSITHGIHVCCLGLLTLHVTFS